LENARKTNITFEKTKVKTLTWCLEDWTPLYYIYNFVEEYYRYNDLNSLKETTLNVIKNLLEEGLIVAGTLQKDNTFKIWDKGIKETLIEIKNKWDALNRELYPHEIVWFDITEKGKKQFEYLNSLPELKETDPFYFDEEKS
jgi:predicted transcriptional regulator